MRPGYGPARRNRNSGTRKAGHGQDNRFCIPRSQGLIFWEAVGEHVTTTRNVHKRELVFVVERVKPGYFYSCTVDDVVELLSMVPEDHLEDLQAVVFRQSTRKQKLGAPTWGRLAYFAEPKRGETVISSGATIFLEAVSTAERMKWPRSESPEDKNERERLAADGHSIVFTGREYLIGSNPDACRNTQLYRTLLHELGHWVDWLNKVERPSATGDFEQLSERYFRRPAVERDAFAHRYASEMKQKLLEQHLIPFERIFDSSRLLDQGLRVDDFEVPRI